MRRRLVDGEVVKGPVGHRDHVLASRYALVIGFQGLRRLVQSALCVINTVATDTRDCLAINNLVK